MTIWKLVPTFMPRRNYPTWKVGTHPSTTINTQEAYRHSRTSSRIAANCSRKIPPMILFAKGRVVDGSRASTTTFSISGINFAGTSEVPQAIDVLPTAQFAVPLNLNKDVLGNDNVYDAACTTYPNLKMGSYYYDRENISTSTTNWIAPRYNDQNNKTLATTTDFFAYSPELFTSDPNDDATRNTDADGHIVLGETRADRMLIVLNRMASTSDDENVKPVITLLGNATVTITKDDGYTDAGATAQDEEDGVITDKIVTTNNVNHTT